MQCDSSFFESKRRLRSEERQSLDVVDNCQIDLLISHVTPLFVELTRL